MDAEYQYDLFVIGNHVIISQGVVLVVCLQQKLRVNSVKKSLLPILLSPHRSEQRGVWAVLVLTLVVFLKN